MHPPRARFGEVLGRGGFCRDVPVKSIQGQDFRNADCMTNSRSGINHDQEAWEFDPGGFLLLSGGFPSVRREALECLESGILTALILTS